MLDSLNTNSNGKLPHEQQQQQPQPASAQQQGFAFVGPNMTIAPIHAALLPKVFYLTGSVRI
jgi:hypothetical protein